LPLAEEPADKTSRAAWNINKGFVAAGLIIAGILVAYALWNHFTEPAVPRFNPDNQLAAVEEGLDRITPLESWHRWVEYYQPLAKRGFGVLEHPHQAAIEQHVAQRRMLQATLLIVAAAIAVASIGIAYLWPRS
jgi:hypothetical protein